MEWSTFFTDAGVPSSMTPEYVRIFVKNRIMPSVLADLDKELLKEMGITAIGDVLCILQHVKKLEKDRVDRMDMASMNASAISYMKRSRSVLNDDYGPLKRKPSNERSTIAAIAAVANAATEAACDVSTDKRPLPKKKRIEKIVFLTKEESKSKNKIMSTQVPRRSWPENEGFIIKMPKSLGGQVRYTKDEKALRKKKSERIDCGQSVFSRLDTPADNNNGNGMCDDDVHNVNVFGRLGNNYNNSKKDTKTITSMKTRLETRHNNKAGKRGFINNSSGDDLKGNVFSRLGK